MLVISLPLFGASSLRLIAAILHEIVIAISLFVFIYHLKVSGYFVEVIHFGLEQPEEFRFGFMLEHLLYCWTGVFVVTLPSLVA